MCSASISNPDLPFGATELTFLPSDLSGMSFDEPVRLF
jgi:hypothetical protein